MSQSKQFNFEKSIAHLAHKYALAPLVFHVVSRPGLDCRANEHFGAIKLKLNVIHGMEWLLILLDRVQE